MGEVPFGKQAGAGGAPVRRWCWHSTLETFDAGTASILAIVEFTVAAGLLVWLLIDGRFIHLWRVASLSVILLLLRTPRSIAHGVEWMVSADDIPMVILRNRHLSRLRDPFD